MFVCVYVFLTVSAFYVGVTSSSVAAATAIVSFSPIDFVNYETPYNTSSNTFSVAEQSLYWFHLSAGVPANSGVNYRLNGLNYSAFVYSSVTAYPQDQLTTDTLQMVPANTLLSVSTVQSLYSSTSFYETAWFGFRLDNLFNPLIAFGVQLTQAYTTSSAVIFNRVLVNIGNGYSINDGSFTAPINGVYFFSLTTTSILCIYINNVDLRLCGGLNDNAHTSNDLGSARASIMLTLNANDKVQVIPQSNYLINTNQDGFANFNGFLYSPISANKVTWSVSRAASASGPYDNLLFHFTNANLAYCWIAAFNNVIIPVSGVYYVDICSFHCGAPYFWCSGNGDTAIQVLRNGNVIINSKLSIITYDNCATRSRAVTVSLIAGDELRVKIPTAGCHFSDYHRTISFNGFLLFATF